MKLVATITFLLLFATSVAANDWVKALKDGHNRVPRLEMQSEGSSSKGTCSGVVLNKDEGFILTAAHCVATPKTKEISITVTDRHAEVVKINEILDLAVVRAKYAGMENVELAPKNPEMGTEVAILGYAFGASKIAAQIGHISQPYNDETKTMWVNIDGIFGDSGGLIFNILGQLVGMTSKIFSAGPAHLTGAVPVEAVKDFVEKFLPKKP